MSTEIENQTLELLVATVEDEKKIVTYRWLSRSMGFSVNVAKQFMESYLTSVGQGKAHGTYYVARKEKETGSQIISLVSQEKIQDAKKDPGFVGCHIYSLEPSQPIDLAILSTANAEATQLQQGKDINMYRIVQNHDVVISKSNTRTVTPAKPAPAITSSRPAVSGEAASSGLLGAKPAVGSPASSSTSSASNSKTKPTPASKASAVSSFFGKSATKPLTTPASSNNSPSAPSKPAPRTSTLNFKPIQKRKAASEDEDDVDSEEERDRRLALSSRLDQDMGDIHDDKGVKKAGSTPEMDVDAVKKKQRSARRLAFDDDDEVEEDEPIGVKGGRNAKRVDSDDEDEALTMSKEARIAHDKEKEAQRQALENMMLIDNTAPVEDDDSHMIDVEAIDSLSAPAAPTQTTHDEIRVREDGVRVRRVRGTRIVTKRKTSKNDRGYLVTEDVLVQEPYSEDEVISDQKAAPAPPPPARVAAVEAPKPAGGAKKKGAASGNQSLLNFFSKK